MSATFTPEEKALLYPVNPALSYERAAFKLVRLLRHNRRLILSQEMHLISELAQEWLSEVSPTFPGFDHGDLLYFIQTNWTAAHWPLGGNPLEDAVEAATLYPNIPPHPQDPTLGATHYAVMRVAYHLTTAALRNGETRFYLSSHDLARRLGVAQTAVFRALRRLEANHQITTVKKGRPGCATTYLSEFWTSAQPAPQSTP